MHQNPNNTNNPESEANSNRSYTVSSQPWWHGVGHDGFSQQMLKESTTNNSLPKQLTNGDLGTKTSKSRAKGGSDEGSDLNQEMQMTAASQSDRKFGEQQPLRHAVSVMHQPMCDYLTPPTQLELVGHNIACASFPYSDSCYGGVVPAYGPQAFVHSHYVGVHPARMALPLEMAEEPVYVNAKQYHGILRRRQIRAKAELEKKLIKVRKPYLHESRHLHAMRRARGCGGRFLNTKKLDGHASGGAAQDNCTNSVATFSTQTTNTSSSGSVPQHNTRSTADSSTGRQEAKEPNMHQAQPQQTYSDGNGKTYSIGSGNGNGRHAHHQGFQLFRYHSLSDDKVEEGDFSGQQSERIVVNGAQNRALTIK